MSTYTDASLIVTPNAVKDGKLYSLKGADLDVVRATTATYVGADGLIQTALANVPRLDYTNGSCPSILVEPQRTNLIRNSLAIGAVVGSPGTLPTNWSIFVGAGLTTTVVGLGVEKGLNYVDLKISGTATSTVYAFRYQLDTFVSATLNQPYTISTYFKKIQNNLPTGFGISIIGRTSASSFSEAIASTILQSTMTNDLQRYAISGTCVNANTVYIDSTVRFDCVIGQVYDFTFRVSAPQLEAGANATSLIQTVSTSVTRNADVISKSGISDLIGQTEGTIFVDYNKVLANDTTRNIISITDGTASNMIEIWDGVGSGNLGKIIYTYFASNIVKTSGIGQPTISPSGRYKICLTYLITPSLVNFKFFINGVKLDDSNFTYDAFSNPLTRINIGNRNGIGVGVGSHNLDFILKTRISDTEAINLTTL